MIKTIVAYTEEVDNAQKAAQEILAQLDLAENQRKNTVGIVACHYEFIASGALKAVCEALPFEVVGSISSAQAVREASGTLMLAIMMLTSDDVRFVTGVTPSLLEEPGKKIAETYREAAAGETEKPALMLLYSSFMPQNSGDDYAEVLSRESGGVPCFGTLAIDDTNDFSYCFSIIDGEAHRDKMALVLLYGDVHPKFFTATISSNKIMDKEALITKSEDHILMEVNDCPVTEYYDELGLKKASETSYAMTSLPAFVDYNDGSPPVSRVFIAVTPEGNGLYGGTMPQGGTLRIGVFEKPDILLTSGEAVDKALADIKGASAFLVYSCIARHLAMGAELMAELDLIRDRVGEKLPFMVAYSGGEFCPTQISDDKAINRFHNNTFIACVF